LGICRVRHGPSLSLPWSRFPGTHHSSRWGRCLVSLIASGLVGLGIGGVANPAKTLPLEVIHRPLGTARIWRFAVAVHNDDKYQPLAGSGQNAAVGAPVSRCPTATPQPQPQKSDNSKCHFSKSTALCPKSSSQGYTPQSEERCTYRKNRRKMDVNIVT
jgi:hypothetical protein